MLWLLLLVALAHTALVQIAESNPAIVYTPAAAWERYSGDGYTNGSMYSSRFSCCLLTTNRHDARRARLDGYRQLPGHAVKRDSELSTNSAQGTPSGSLPPSTALQRIST